MGTGVAMVAVAALMISGCGNDDSCYYYVPPLPCQISEAITIMLTPTIHLKYGG